MPAATWAGYPRARGSHLWYAVRHHCMCLQPGATCSANKCRLHVQQSMLAENFIAMDMRRSAVGSHLDIGIKVLPAKHAEALTAPGEQNEQASSTVVVLPVGLCVTCEVQYALSEQADADRHRACVVLE